MNPEEVLGILPNANLAEIEGAYARQMSHWQDLLSHPNRSAEATAMIASLDEAHEVLMARLDGGEGGLMPPDLGSHSPSTPGQQHSIDACPHCGYELNPQDALFCVNLGCRGELIRTCPSCSTEYPWHQEVCHRCGASYEEAIAEIERQNEDRERARVQRDREERQIESLLQDWPRSLRIHMKPLSKAEQSALQNRIQAYRSRHKLSKPFLYRPGPIVLSSIAGFFFPVPFWLHVGYVLARDPEVGSTAHYLGWGCLTFFIIITIGMFIAFAGALVFGIASGFGM